MAFDKRHDQPGRRFAKGASWDDIKLGAFGFVSHMFFFMFLGGLWCYLLPETIPWFVLATGIIQATCLVIRGLQVGKSTTVESIAAIEFAYETRNDPVIIDQRFTST